MKALIHFFCALTVMFFSAIDSSHAFRCENAHSTPASDNRNMCELMKAGTSDDFACVAEHRGRCASKCGHYNFQESCLMNQACEWHDALAIMPCVEKAHGFEPNYDQVVE